MSRKHDGKKKLYKKIALHRIRYLFSLAEACGLQGNLHRSDRYVMVARKISMKYLVPIPTEYSRKFCKHCYSFLLPPKTCRVRLHRGMIIFYCLKCKRYYRRPLHRPISTSPRR